MKKSVVPYLQGFIEGPINLGNLELVVLLMFQKGLFGLKKWTLRKVILVFL